jgi:hypothetical protein
MDKGNVADRLAYLALTFKVNVPLFNGVVITRNDNDVPWPENEMP